MNFRKNSSNFQIKKIPLKKHSMTCTEFKCQKFSRSVSFCVNNCHAEATKEKLTKKLHEFL